MPFYELSAVRAWADAKIRELDEDRPPATEPSTPARVAGESTDEAYYAILAQVRTDGDDASLAVAQQIEDDLRAARRAAKERRKKNRGSGK